MGDIFDLSDLTTSKLHIDKQRARLADAIAAAARPLPSARIEQTWKGLSGRDTA